MPSRLFATVEARATAGLYRSDDAGESWYRVNSDPRVVARPNDAVRSARPSDQPRHRLRADDRRVEVHRRRQDLHGLPRRAGRRRLPADLDQPDQPDIMIMPPTRARHHRERRRDVEQLVQPADRAVLSRHHRQRLPVPRLRRPAGERLGVHLQPRRRRPDHVPRVAPRRRRGIRLRRARSARSRHRLRRQGDALRPAHRAGAEHHAANRCAPPTTASCGPCRCCSRRSTRGSSTSHRTSCGRRRRRPELGPDQPRPHARDVGGAGQRRQVHRQRRRASDASAASSTRSRRRTRTRTRSGPAPTTASST